MARIALGRRDLLLGVYRDRLVREDLEDCYSQATLELLARARSGSRLESTTHVAHALEQKFVSRIHDRVRALSGRSSIEAAIGRGVSFDDPEGRAPELADPSAAVHERVERRIDLGRVREVADELSDDQRLVLFSQISLGMATDEFCRRHGWSPAKFRKIAQRARRRLAVLVSEYGEGERCRRLEADVNAHVARVASEETSARVVRHLENCTACRMRVRDLRAAERSVVAVSMSPGVIGGLSGSAAGTWAGGVAAGGAAVGAGAASGGPLVIGAVKASLVALCLAGLTSGGVLLCSTVRSGGHLVRGPVPAHRAHLARTEHRPARRATVREPPPEAARRRQAATTKSSSAGSVAAKRSQITSELRSPLAPIASAGLHAAAARRGGGSAAAFSPTRAGRDSFRAAPRAQRRPAARSIALGFEGG